MTNALILGCGRSGTSIFGELFESLHGWRYESEPLVDEIPTPGSGECLAVKVPRARADDRPPIGCSVDPDELRRIIPEPCTVFWQVRHPLDAVCSLRVGIADDWGHHPRPPDWQEWLDRPLVERCAHHWAVINGPGHDAVGVDAVTNRFEEMIRDPQASAERALREVGVDPGSMRDEVSAWAARVQDTNNEQFVEAVTSRRRSRPDHDRRVGRWRQNLAAAEVASIVPIVAAGAARFGYELPP